MEQTQEQPQQVATPFPGRVLIERDKPAERVGAIIVPENAREKKSMGTVVAVHGGVHMDGGGFRPCWLSVGDRVLFGTFSGTDIEVDGKLYVVMPDHEVLLRLNDGSTAGQATVSDRVRTLAEVQGR